MKKTYVLTATLIISLIFGCISFTNLYTQKNNARNLLGSSLSEVCSDFKNSYDNDNIKNTYYLRITNNLAIALSVLENGLCSDKDIKNYSELKSAVKNLYLCMTKKESSNIALTKDRTLIYKYLTALIGNHYNKNDCVALSKTAEELYWGIKK